MFRAAWGRLDLLICLFKVSGLVQGPSRRYSFFLRGNPICTLKGALKPPTMAHIGSGSSQLRDPFRIHNGLIGGGGDLESTSVLGGSLGLS